MSNVFTTTLVLMYFITPPAKIPTGESKEIQESKAAWTLQSTDHIQTKDSTTCVLFAQKLLAAIQQVNTLTLRAYCLCPSGDGDKNCYAPDYNPAIASTREPMKPTIQAIGPNTRLPKAAPSGAPVEK